MKSFYETLRVEGLRKSFLEFYLVIIYIFNSLIGKQYIVYYLKLLYALL